MKSLNPQLSDDVEAAPHVVLACTGDGHIRYCYGPYSARRAHDVVWLMKRESPVFVWSTMPLMKLDLDRLEPYILGVLGGSSSGDRGSESEMDGGV